MKIHLIALAGLVLVGGCSGGESAAGPSAETQKQSDRLQQIKQSSGGDWEKVSPEDKQYMIDELAHGSESTAKMLLGPPPGGRPGGPPKR